MRIVLALLIPGAFLQAQTTVYLRSSGPAGTYVTGASNSGVSPFHLTVNTTAGLNPGDIIAVGNVCANDGVNSISAANGIRKISAVNGNTDLIITDLNGNDLTSNGNWCTGDANNYSGGPQYIGKLNPFSLVAGQPRGWFDGPTGPVTQKWALGTQNGLVSLSCASNVCTATTNYNHGVTAGNHITVWGTTNSNLNNGRSAKADWIVNSDGLTATQFTFNTSGVPGGTYTTNPACGPGPSPNGTIQGTDNCVRISQLATLNNPEWALTYPNIANNIIASNRYKSIGDDPNGYLGLSPPLSVAQSYWAPIGTLFLVDQSNAPALSALVYILTHVHRLGGAGFVSNEQQREGGNGELGDYGSFVWESLSPVYAAGIPYLTPAQKTTALNRIYNDLTDSPPCTKSVFQQKPLATGTTQAASSTNITLAAADSQADNYYVNNVIMAVTGTTQTYGLVTAYSSATKIATVASWSSAAPAAGSTYTVYATISRSGTTITGYNTTFTKDVASGDVVYGGNIWPSMPATTGTYITNISSDTSLSGRNGAYIAATATPGIYWYANQPTSDSVCGFKWIHNHWYGTPTGSPITYPTYGGGGSAMQKTQPTLGSNNGYTFSRGRTTMDLVAADDDPRAVIDLAEVNTFYFDYQLAFSLTYTTGFAQSGSHYSFARTLQDGPASAWALGHSVVGYPGLDPTGPWVTGPSLVKMFSAMPDTPSYSGYGLTWFPALWGAASGNFINSATDTGQAGQNFVPDAGSEFAPAATSSQYFQSWLIAHNGYSWSRGTANADLPLKLDPRRPTADFTTQPRQYLFSATSYAACTTLFGTCPFPQNMRADAFVSRTGWTSNSDSLLVVQSRTYAGDHDNPQPGTVQLYKAGFLLANDTIPVGSADADPATNRYDPTKNDVAFEFGGANTIKRGALPGQTATANIIRWASANSGAWPTAYGDQNSRYAYALMDLSGAYTTAYNRVQRHIVHLKKPGLEEIIVQYDDVDVSNSPTAVRNQVHYPQNGELIQKLPLLYYDEGNTSCPGSADCSSLNTTRQVLEQENGAAFTGTPSRVYNLITTFLSPDGASTTVQWDGSTFAGSNGHTNRVSVCGGSACGSKVSGFEDLIVHKVAAQPDTSLTVKALNPDSKWTGVQTTDKVVLFARYGNTPVTVTFQTDHPGTAQYLIAGLQGGMVYRVHKNGAPGSDNIPGSGGSRGRAPGTDVARQMVAVGDNTLYFEAPAGNYTIAPESLGNLLIGDQLIAAPPFDAKPDALTNKFIGYLSALRLVDRPPAQPPE